MTPHVELVIVGLWVVTAGCSAGGTNHETPQATGGVPNATGGTPPMSAGGALPPATGGTPVAIGVFPRADAGPRPPVPDGGPKRTKVTLDECGPTSVPGLSADEVTRLRVAPPGALELLYPYEGTVFPRGLIAPVLMWNQTKARAVYLHISSTYFEYEGCLSTPTSEVQVPQAAWDTGGQQTAGEKDPFTIEVAVLDGAGGVTKAVRHVTIAQATLKGSIYYNSYNSKVSGATGGGTILKMRAGQQAELFLKTGACTGCHSVSQNGSKLLAREILTVAGGYVYGLTPDTAANPPALRSATRSAFVGLSPDGTTYITNAWANGVGPWIDGGIGGAAPATAGLYETDSGSAIPDSGIPPTATMPTFGTDGRSIVFNDLAVRGGHGLALMRYDPSTRKASDYRQIFDSGTALPGWPFLLPDNGGVVFTTTTAPSFSGTGVGISIARGPASDLAIVDTASGNSVILARAMGFTDGSNAGSDTTYLPGGTADLHQNYYPTVSPIAAGGYYWVFFDSVRSYGSGGRQRQIWGTALTIAADGRYLSDPSHPAFYLSGQEQKAANHRAFAALDPCKKDGASCDGGVDCCSGFCTNGICGVPDVPRCSEQGETCKSSGDCCDPRETCISGFCAHLIQ